MLHALRCLSTWCDRSTDSWCKLDCTQLLVYLRMWPSTRLLQLSQAVCCTVLQRAPALRAQQAMQAATYGTLVLAGIPALYELCFDVTAGHVDTHVLMTLAVMGTMAMGAASEVPPWPNLGFQAALQSPEACLHGALQHSC